VSAFSRSRRQELVGEFDDLTRAALAPVSQPRSGHQALTERRVLTAPDAHDGERLTAEDREVEGD
jgi:hypothetical protein